MKLIGWMRTINRSTFDPSKEFKGSFCCLRTQVSSEVQDIRTNSFSFSRQSHHDPTPQKTGEELWFDEGGFSGFLAIGTLGRDPETPKFTASVVEDDVTGAKEEMAKLVTEKLDKFLEEYPEDSSSKQVERSKAESDACPAQGHSIVPLSTEPTKRINEVKKIKGLLKSVFKRRKESVQIFQSKVHPVMCTPERNDSKIDDRRSCINGCNLKVPSLNGRFLVPGSISKVNKKKENWIKTDAECKSRCYEEQHTEY
ncbi:Uncharacterized protein Rs2_45540 [Raphanus sativus]|nr:Uncharacterized protein Rs2_45540 [Raphanus sativus]